MPEPLKRKYKEMKCTMTTAKWNHTTLLSCHTMHEYFNFYVIHHSLSYLPLIFPPLLCHTSSIVTFTYFRNDSVSCIPVEKDLRIETSWIYRYRSIIVPLLTPTQQ